MGSPIAGVLAGQFAQPRSDMSGFVGPGGFDRWSAANKAAGGTGDRAAFDQQMGTVKPQPQNKTQPQPQNQSQPATAPPGGMPQRVTPAVPPGGMPAAMQASVQEMAPWAQGIIGNGGFPGGGDMANMLSNIFGGGGGSIFGGGGGNIFGGGGGNIFGGGGGNIFGGGS